MYHKPVWINLRIDESNIKPVAPVNAIISHNY